MEEDPQRLPAVHEAWLPREHALYRPRHSGRQRTALTCALVFFLTPTLLWVFGVRPTEIENHKLAGFPSLSEGWGVFTGLPAWATDQLIFRSGAIAAADGISRALFGEPAPLDQGGVPNTGPLPGSPPAPNGPLAPNGPVPGPTGGEAGYRKVIEGNDGWLYYGYDTEAKCVPTRPIGESVQKLLALRDAVERSGRRFVLVVAPDKTTMVPQHLPGSYPGKDCAAAASPEVWDRLVREAGAVDLRPALTAEQQRMGREIYPAKDSHWTDDGSIVFTRTLAEQIRPGSTAGWVAAPDGDYTIDADLPPLIGKRGERSSARFHLAPDGITNRNGEQINNIEEPVRIQNRPLPGIIDERTLLYGDSFLTISSRYLAAGFRDLTMLAYFNSRGSTSEAVEAFADSEVVVVEMVERAASAGNLPFLQDAFIRQVRETLAARPVR